MVLHLVYIKEFIFVGDPIFFICGATYVHVLNDARPFAITAINTQPDMFSLQGAVSM